MKQRVGKLDVWPNIRFSSPAAGELVVMGYTGTQRTIFRCEQFQGGFFVVYPMDAWDDCVSTCMNG